MILQKIIKHLIHHFLFYLHALGGIYYTIFCHASRTSLCYIPIFLFDHIPIDEPHKWVIIWVHFSS